VLLVALSVVLETLSLVLVVLSVVLDCDLLDVLAPPQGLGTLSPPTALELLWSDSDSGDCCHDRQEPPS